MSSHLYQTLSAKNIDPNIIKLLFLKLEKNLKDLSEKWIALDVIEIESHSSFIDFKLNFLSETKIQTSLSVLFFDDSYKKFEDRYFRPLPEFSLIITNYVFAPYVPLILSHVFYIEQEQITKEQITLSELFGTLKLFTK